MKNVTDIPPLPTRKPDAHKGDFGRVLAVVGSVGMTGAAVLCCEAALRSGCGLVRLVCPRSLNHVFEMKTTEVMTLPVEESPHGTISDKAVKAILQEAKRFNCLAIGPGLGNNLYTQRLVRDLVRRCHFPIVLDADGINAISAEPQILLDHQAPLVITPHPGEMARLASKSIDEVQKKRRIIAVTFARAFDCVVVLKGAGTVVTDSRGVYVNETGNSGMATAGSGDVLTGMIASFVAQGMTSFDAAIAGVYLHGLAGDIAAAELTEYSVTASDILNAIPEAFAEHTAGAAGVEHEEEESEHTTDEPKGD